MINGYDPSNDQMAIDAFLKSNIKKDIRVGGISYIRPIGLGMHCYTATVIVTPAFDHVPTIEVETYVLYVDGPNVTLYERINLTNL